MHWNASSMNQNLGLYPSYPSSRQTSRTASPSIGSESIMSPSFKERGGNGSKDISNIMAMIIILCNSHNNNTRTTSLSVSTLFYTFNHNTFHFVVPVLLTLPSLFLLHRHDLLLLDLDTSLVGFLLVCQCFLPFFGCIRIHFLIHQSW